MRVFEQGVLPASRIYFHTPGRAAQELFLTLTCTGVYDCDGSYRVEVEDGGYSSYWDGSYIREVICKYGDTEAHTNYHASAEPTSYIQKPENDFYKYWCKRSYDNEVYDCYYFPADYSRISDREITFAHTFSPNSDYLRLFTYRFDEAGKLTEIIEQGRDSWGSRATRYIITDTPESEIRTWVENIEAKR